MKRRVRTPSEQGFTLLEMLVALAVLSIAALALVRLDAFTVRGAADLNDDALAGIVAANAAATIASDPAPPATGGASETVSNAGRTWRVTRNVRRTADPELLRIDITASGGGGRATLTIIRSAQ